MYCLKIKKNGRVQKLFCKSEAKLKELADAVRVTSANGKNYKEIIKKGD